jgi:two-component system chemotaxis sensor kinase CheA
VDRERLAARLLATFSGELDEQVQTMNADLLVLESTPADATHLKSLFRVAHTLKGAARAAGLPVIEHACHALEGMLAEARDGKRSLGDPDFALLFEAADALADAAARLKAGRDLLDSPIEELDIRLSGPLAPGLLKTAGTAPAPAMPASPRADAPSATKATAAATASAIQLRVDTTRLEGLTAAAGQLLVAGSRVAHRVSDGDALHEMALRTSARWRQAVRELRLAAVRAGNDGASSRALHSIDQQLRKLVAETSRLSAGLAAEARSLGQAVDEVARGVHGLRMRPFADACEALPRTARDIAAVAGKEVRLEVSGAEVEADRVVVDGLREALLHLVRNAVDHGIEAPADRGAKPRAGRVAVAAAVRGDRLVVTVTDDGAGLDRAAIRRKAKARGLDAPGDDAALDQMLFAGGLSTRAEATSVSGRGVGLDLVRAAVEKVRGSLSIESTPGRGTTFTIECPPTLVTLRAVLVGTGPHLFAIPADHVVRMVRIKLDEIRQVEGRSVFRTESGPVPLVSLARVLGPPVTQGAPASRMPAVILASGERRAVALVDELVGEQEIVLRPPGRIGKLPRFVSGATQLGSGRVATVLAADEVIAAALGLPAGDASFAFPSRPAAARHQILVVDDSITTRTLEQSILEAAGYAVRSAVDGADAWRILQEQGAELVVADVEMPRMDGFALCAAIRDSKRFKDLPVILVTALETPEHRARGLESGADAYIGKSSFDQQALLDTIRQLLD